MFKESPTLSPSFSFHGQQGVKLQPLESSTDSEGKDNFADVRPTVYLKNESSVEIDAMELDVYRKSHPSREALCPSQQNNRRVHNSIIIGNRVGEEAGVKMANTELPDMNGGLPALSAVANLIDDGGTSTSRTQSLDAGHLLKQPSVSTAAACPDIMGPEPSSRCVKRLKSSTSDAFTHGNESSKIGEVSSHEKANKIFNTMMNCSKTSSEPTVGRSQLVLLQTAKLLKKGDCSSDSVRKHQEMCLSHPWIQRCCRHRNASPNKKPEALVLCEPQSSKPTRDELQKNQFSSIAAMALMGKAMNGIHPCEFRRRGSFKVWST